MARNKARRLATPLPKSFVLCGQLTLDAGQPQNNSIPFPKDVSLDVRSVPIDNIQTLQNTAIGMNLAAQFTAFFTAQSRALHLDAIQINVAKATRYLVWSSEPAFKKACGNQEIRTWLEEYVIDERRTAVMVVGLYTYSNATYVHTHGNKAGGEISVSLPTEAAQARLTGGAGGAQQDHHTFGMPGEHIFAIEYKRIKFKHWSKKKVEEARLEDAPNRWEVFFGDRSKGMATSDDKENIFEFDLDNNENGTNSDDDELGYDEDEDDEEGVGGPADDGVSMTFEGSMVDNGS